MEFKLFAGLGGSFNNETCIGVEDFENKDDALDAAYEAACEIYDQYSGTHGVSSQEEILLDLKGDETYSELTEDELDEEAWIIYDKERESWVIFHIEKVND